MRLDVTRRSVRSDAIVQMGMTEMPASCSCLNEASQARACGFASTLHCHRVAACLKMGTIHIASCEYTTGSRIFE